MAMLFAYGTLRDATIFRLVSGLRARSRPALLSGYRCAALRHADYPVLVRCPTAHVRGVVYEVAPSAWPRLDRYEGGEYRRRRIVVRLADGRRLSAFAYLPRPGMQRRVSRASWDFADFCADGAERLRQRLRSRRIRFLFE